jgi:hypothetical protein
MFIEWDCLMQTAGDYIFTLGVWAVSESSAKSRAKKLSQGCKVLGVKEANNNRRKAFTLLKGVNALPV